LYSFCSVTGCFDGLNPDAGLIFDAAGNLYGTTIGGGPSANYCHGGCGTAFKLTPNADGTWTESVLHDFYDSDGADPNASLIFDAAGNLYGTTFYGGNLSKCGGFGCGVVFELTPNSDGSWTESELYAFSGGADGGQPIAGLIFDTAGNLYGTSAYGGAHHRGTVFKLTANADGTWTESVLYSFGANGGGDAPAASLIFDASGNLYGTTSRGGAHHNGTVFKLTPNADGSWTERVLQNFRSAGDSRAGLIFDAAGNLYGTAFSGGPANGGAVFKLAPQSDGNWTYSVLHFLFGKPATGPVGGLVLDKAGNLYSTTQGCGSGCAGVVFEITP
jgi:uncharacterized repeat protein (TIGR03803 family)